MGASIDFRATPYIVRKGGTLLLVKIGIAMLLGLVFGRLLGEAPVAAGMFAGLSTLAIVAAMNDTNGGLYMALMGQYGRPRDVGAYTVMSLEIGPFLTMVTLGRRGSLGLSVADAGRRHPAAARRHDPRQSRPRDARVPRPRHPGDDPVLRLRARRGARPHARSGRRACSASALGVAVVVVTGIPLFFADRLTGGNGVAGVAAASTAGNAAAVPAIVAAANPAYADAAGPATILVAACVVVTAILVPSSPPGPRGMRRPRSEPGGVAERRRTRSVARRRPRRPASPGADMADAGSSSPTT